MKMRFSIIVLALFGIFGSLFLFTEDTMAAQSIDAGGWIGKDTTTGGGSGGGGGGSCSSSDDYWREDCAGASWIFYEESEWLRANKDKLIGDSIELKFPLSDLYNNRKGGFVFSLPVSQCVTGRSGSGFWHYGLNGYGKSSSHGGFYWFASGFSYLQNDPVSGAWGSTYYNVPANKWGHWETYSNNVIEWIPERTSNNVDQTLYGYTQDGWQPLFVANSSTKMQKIGAGGQVTTVSMTGSKSSDNELLVEAFNEADKLYEGPGNATVMPTGIYAFCYHLVPNGTEGWVKFRAGSKVETNGTDRRQTFDENGELSGTSKTESPASGVYDETVQVGESVSVVFKHYATSLRPSGSQGLKYEITTSGFNAANVSLMGINGNGAGTFTKTFNSEYDGMYAPDDAPSGDRRRVEKNTYSVQFDAPGEYLLCEQIVFPLEFQVVGPSNIPNQVTSKVCTRIKVNAANNVHESQSTVLVSDDGISADTGIVSANTTKETASITKDVGDTVTVSFAHRGFSSLSEKKVSYTVSGVPVAGTGYTITRGNGLSLGDNISGRANLTSRYDTLRYSTSSATASDFYQITFDAAGTYSFCETFKINSIETKVCAKFSVRSSGKSLGVSQVSSGSTTRNTGVVTSDMNTVSKTIDLGEFKPNDTVSFSFQHWGGINPKGKGSYTITATMVSSPGGETGGSWVGTDAHTNVTMKSLYMKYDGVKYYSSTSEGSLSSGRSNSYSYKVYNPGGYKFCQKLFVNGPQLTEVCVTWTVHKEPSCADAAEGETKVASYVKNDSTGAQGAIVYAKPNDTVTWHECYYAGVQQYADKYVTVTHAEPSHPLWPATDPSANTNKKFKDAITWGNYYVVSYPDGATGGNTYSNGSVVNIGFNSITHSMGIKPTHVGKTETTLKDTITSSTPITASYTNHGIHRWECRPSNNNTGGTVAKYDWVSYDPQQFHDECQNGTERYVCESGWSGPDSNNICSKTTSSTEKVNANSSTSTKCPDGDWSGPDSYGYCSRTQYYNVSAIEVDEYSCSKYKKAIYLQGKYCYKKSDYSGTAYDAEISGSHYECSNSYDTLHSATYTNYWTGETTTYYWCSGSSYESRKAEEVTTYSCNDGDSGPYTSNGWHYCNHPTTTTETKTATTKKCFNSSGSEIAYTQVEDKKWEAVEWYQNPKCKHSNDYITYSYTTGPSTATSGVRVPYNYKLTATVDAGTGVVYSGETMSLNKGVVNVETKYNGVTSGTYATVAKGVKTKLIAFVSSYNMTGGGGVVSTSDLCGMVTNKQCAVLAENSNQTFNSAGTVTGSTNNSVYSGSWNAFDAKAGDYVCFMMAVYPATSGSDTNMGDFDGDGMWYRSNASCKQIAKKPTFQVWGSGLFSGGNVNSYTATKNNLYPLYPDYYPAYQKSGSTNAKLFGSWVEQNMTLVGTTGTVSSGSSVAGGSTHTSTTDFCKYRVPLTFSNYSSVGCPSVQRAGSMGLSTSSFGSTSSRSNYIDYWLSSSPTANIAGGSSINLNVSYDSMQSASGVDVRYSVSSGDVRLVGTTIDKKVTHIVKASAGNVYIDGNIYYNGNGLTNINQVPKLIVYGRNIYINCGVTEIDAILIAEGTIDTCKDGGADSAATRSNQLYIRGMTISNTLTLGRTYGAATGAYSDVPAEIINYDSSAILWGKHMSGVGESNTMTMTYIRELAPRY